MATDSDEEGAVEVTIQDAEGSDEVTIKVPSSAILRDCKEVLAKLLRRPALLEEGVRFVQIGKGGPITLPDHRKLGAKRALILDGGSLAPPEPERGPQSFDTFDEYDTTALVDTPRTLRACAAEGIAPKDLTYVPIEYFNGPRMQPRIVELRFCFFEAYRQDLLFQIRQARQRVIEEEELADDANDASPSAASTSSQGFPRHRASSGMATSCGPDASWNQNSLAGIGGIWSGPLAPPEYPTVRDLFDQLFKVRRDVREGKLYDLALRIKKDGDAGGTPERWAMPTAKPFDGCFEFDVTLDASTGKATGLNVVRDAASLRIVLVKADGLAAAWNKQNPSKAVQEGDYFIQVNKAKRDAAKIAAEMKNKKVLHIRVKRSEFTPGNDVRRLTGVAEEHSEKVRGMADTLRGLPYGKRGGEGVEGLILRTESICTEQRHRNSRLEKGLQVEKKTVDAKVKMAEACRYEMELSKYLEEEKRDLVDKAHMKNRGEWAKGVQKDNFKLASDRNEYWKQRRAIIAQGVLDGEDERNRRTQSILQRDHNKTRSVSNLRDLQKAAYSRRWLDRRSRWAQSYKEVRSSNRMWEDHNIEKDAVAAARVEDQKLRMNMWIEWVREFKAIRKDFQDMTKHRELRRQAFRRKAIGDELAEVAAKVLEAETMSEDSDLSDMPSEGAGASPETSLPKGPFGLASTRSTSRQRRPLPLAFSAGSTPQVSGSPSPVKLPTLRGVPRFDFPRLAGGTPSPLAMTLSASMEDTRMSHSASAPVL